MDDNGMARGLGIGFLAGAVVGVTIGLLYAPKTGAETRAMLMEKANQVKQKGGGIWEKVSKAADMVKEKVSTIRRKASEQA